MVNKRRGFTIIEVAIYTAISGILLVAVLRFFSESVYLGNKLNTSSLAITDAQYLMQRIDIELRSASDIVYVNSSDICLENTVWFLSRDSTRIYKSGDSIFLTKSSASNCSGASGTKIGSNLTFIESLTFTSNNSSNDSESIKYTIVFKAPNAFKGSEFPGGNDNFTFSSSATIRKW